MELRALQPSTTSSSRVILHDGPVFSLILPYNDMFGHVFTTAVSLAAQVLPLVTSSSNALVLVPEAGALMSLLLAAGVPSQRILALSKPHFVYSPRATLFLRKAPFNVITAHWPGRSSLWLRQRLREGLWRQLKLNNSTNNAGAGPLDEAARKWVVVLCRPKGPRYLANEAALLAAVKESIKGTRFSLFVFGRTPISNASPSAWMDTAAVFLQAAAVIGVHGSAFGNAILCHPETVLIEVNAPWVAKQQDDANDRPATRDAIMSSMRAAGSLYYYNVFPRSLYAAVAEEGNVPPASIQRHKPHGGVMGSTA